MDAKQEELEQYISSHIDAEPSLLHELDRTTHCRYLAARMVSGHVQGMLLKMIVRMVNPRRALEIGTFTGYSALSIASGFLRDEAHLHTIEIDDELEGFIRSYFERSEDKGRITLHIGDALAVINDIGGEFDFVFVDGNKREYVRYYEAVLPRMTSGGVMVVDNVLWDGKVVGRQAKRDAQTEGIRAFNDYVAADGRVEKVIVPVRDGLTIIRKV